MRLIFGNILRKEMNHQNFLKNFSFFNLWEANYKSEKQSKLNKIFSANYAQKLYVYNKDILLYIFRNTKNVLI